MEKYSSGVCVCVCVLPWNIYMPSARHLSLLLAEKREQWGNNCLVSHYEILILLPFGHSKPSSCFFFSPCCWSLCEAKRTPCGLWVNVLRVVRSKSAGMNLIYRNVNKYFREVQIIGMMWHKRWGRACGSTDIISPENVCDSITDTKFSCTSARRQTLKSLCACDATVRKLKPLLLTPTSPVHF